MSREIGHPEGEAVALYCMTVAALHSDNAGEAVKWGRQAARIDPETYSSDTARGTQAALAAVLMEAGDLEEARDQCTKALAAAGESGDLRMEAYGAYVISDLDLRSGDLPGTWRQLGSAVRLAIGAAQMLTPLLSCLSVGGELCGLSGRWEEAVTVLAAERTLNRATGRPERPDTKRRLEKLLHRAAEALGPERTHAAVERGAAVSWRLLRNTCCS